MSLYQKHVFICTNIRENDPSGCCGPKGGENLQKILKQKLTERGLSATVRANKSGCLGACAEGAVLVIYPQGIWYGHVTLADLDEIIDQSIVNNNIIKRLELVSPQNPQQK